MRRVSLLALLCFVLAIWMHVHLYSKYSQNNQLTQILYLPSGKLVKLLSFGYESLMADYVYLWSIQYFTGPRARIEYLPHAYGIITDLDPYYMDAYYTGALMLFYEGRNPKAGLELLDQGLANNPEEWFLPTDAGFYCATNLKDYDLAANYFEKASRIWGAPILIKELLASMRYKAGDKEVAYKLWLEIYKTTDRPSLRQASFQHVHDLKVMVDLEHLQKAIASFQEMKSHVPLNLDQLVAVSLIQEIPLDPEGNSYLYHADQGKVEYTGKLLLIYRSRP